MIKVYEVVPLEANLRSAPRVEKKTGLTRLKQGQQVRAEGAAVKGWLRVSAELQGTPAVGYVHESVVRVATTSAVPPPPAVLPNIPEAHLPTKAAIRIATTNGRAFSLNDPAAPRRVTGDAAVMAARLGQDTSTWRTARGTARAPASRSATYTPTTIRT